MQYWVAIDNQRKGPFTIEELQNMNISPDSLIWRDGLEDWIKAKDLSELKVLINFESEDIITSKENPIEKINNSEEAKEVTENATEPETENEAVSEPLNEGIAENESAKDEVPVKNADEAASTAETAKETSDATPFFIPINNLSNDKSANNNQANNSMGNSPANDYNSFINNRRYVPNDFYDKDPDTIPPRPKNYLALAIIATFFSGASFPFLGILSIIFSILVNFRFNKCDFKRAKLFSKLTLIVSIVTIVISLLSITFMPNIILNESNEVVNMNEPSQEREWYMPQ